jgi:tetratricopeptide (TPR) repeat protein
VGQLLKVDAVLTGRITKRGDNLNIATDLVNTADGTEIWGAQYTRKPTDISSLQDEITRDVAAKLRTRLTGEQQKQIARGTTANSEAYQLYLKGRYYWNKRGADNINQSIDLFKQAIANDPSYALAHAGLADAYSVAPSYTGMASLQASALAMPAARKAIELDPQLAEAHGAMATALANAFQWPEAEKEFHRALELAPNDAHLHYFYAFLNLLAMGKTEAALGEIRTALLLDPLSPIINVNYGYTLYMAHRYDEALQQFRKTLEIDPNFRLTHFKFSYFYAGTGKWAEAVAEYRAYFGVANLEATNPTPKGFAELVRANLAQIDTRGHASEMWRAGAFAAEGDREQAIAWLLKAAANHDSEFSYAIRDPIFDALRSDRRYVELMRGVGLPP